MYIKWNGPLLYTIVFTLHTQYLTSEGGPKSANGVPYLLVEFDPRSPWGPYPQVDLDPGFQIYQWIWMTRGQNLWGSESTGTLAVDK